MLNLIVFNWVVLVIGLIVVIEIILIYWGLIINFDENIIRDEDNWYLGCCIFFNYMCVLLKL